MAVPTVASVCSGRLVDDGARKILFVDLAQRIARDLGNDLSRPREHTHVRVCVCVRACHMMERESVCVCVCGQCGGYRP